MANKNNKKGEELNGIENLNESLTSFSTKVEKNKKQILGVVAVVIVVVLAGLSWWFFSKRSDENSSKEYTKAIVTSMKKAMDAANTVGQDSAQIIAENAMVAELEKVAKSEDGKNGASLANLTLASLYLNKGEAQKALNALEAANVDEPVMAMNVTLLKGDCYVSLKKYNEALTAYNEAFDKAKEENPEIAARALKKKASVLDAQKKYAEALAAYEQILKDYPNTLATTAGEPGMSRDEVEALAERERALAGK